MNPRERPAVPITSVSDELPRELRVLKFGGTSLQDAARIRSVVEIISGRVADGPLIIVVSALGGITNALVEAAQAPVARRSHDAIVERVERRHRLIAGELGSAGEARRFAERLEDSIEELRDLLHGISLLGECPPRTLDRILSHGELLSSALVTAMLRDAKVGAEACDARDLIVTDATFGKARVDSEATRERIRAHFRRGRRLQVVTGFLGATPSGHTTTLGRSGSDYTAALVGAALDAEAVEIWTDVDGVMSADPRVVPTAFSLPMISYLELLELSHFGAKVVYPPTVHPARESSISLVIKNTLSPSFPGTWVVEEASPREGHPVRGISSIPRVALLRLEGDWLVGTPGIAERLFGTLAKEEIGIFLITQASSGHSICFAIEPEQLRLAKAKIEEEFFFERRAGLIDDLVVETECSVIAAVGEGMRATPGLAGRLFSVLGRQGVSVRAIAQGSSELNISLVVASKDGKRAIRAIHDAFFQKGIRRARVFIAGLGRVGSVLVDQIAGAEKTLRSQMALHLSVRALASSGKAAISRGAAGIDLSRWRTALSEAEEPLEALVSSAIAMRNGPRVFVDCTASELPASHYDALLGAGVAIVSANKLPFSGPGPRYRALKEAAVRGGGLYLETTVGAGLPILDPIANLLLTGDRIQRIEGVLSGTLSFILSEVMRGTSFAAAVRTAWERGFTEPDPREDLGGEDVARKLVILAREAGLEVERPEVVIEPLLPLEHRDKLLSLPLDRFWSALPEADDYFAERWRRVRERGKRLCYTARIGDGNPCVGLVEIERDHPCFSLRGSDNLVAVTSHRYDATPLVIRGPGAGPDVTASGVFAGILRAAQESGW